MKVLESDAQLSPGFPLLIVKSRRMGHKHTGAWPCVHTWPIFKEGLHNKALQDKNSYDIRACESKIYLHSYSICT